MKLCKKCGEHKPLDRFETCTSGSYKGKKYTKLYYKNKCMDCKATEALERYKARRDTEVVKLRERARKKRKEDPSIHRQNNVLQKKHVKRATPKWADRRLLKLIYDNRPLGYDVDHIIPLRGEIMSGLHTPDNLQYLPSDINRNEKRNKIDYNASTSALQVPKDLKIYAELTRNRKN